MLMSFTLLLLSMSGALGWTPTLPGARPARLRSLHTISLSESEASEAPAAESEQPQPPYYCNEEGCWIGEPPPIDLPDGRSFSQDAGVAAHKTVGKVVSTKRKPAPQGIFAPVVVGTKRIMGEKELNKLRAEVIAQHSKVISAFVDTSESKFGQLVLSRLFEAADKDGNGTLDREEVREALHALGFTFVKDKQLDTIMKRADADGNQVIDFEEFVNETPKTLRSGLIKLAKQNGHDLGFLA